MNDKESKIKHSTNELAEKLLIAIDKELDALDVSTLEKCQILLSSTSAVIVTQILHICSLLDGLESESQYLKECRKLGRSFSEFIDNAIDETGPIYCKERVMH